MYWQHTRRWAGHSTPAIQCEHVHLPERAKPRTSDPSYLRSLGQLGEYGWWGKIGLGSWVGMGVITTGSLQNRVGWAF